MSHGAIFLSRDRSLRKLRGGSRLHKTMRAEFVRAADGQYATLAELQAALDGLQHRPAAPVLRRRPPASRAVPAGRPEQGRRRRRPGTRTRHASRSRQDAAARRGVAVVSAHGTISLSGFSYAVGASYAGEPVEAVVAGGLVDILHAGAVIATHAQRFRPDQADRAPRARIARWARDATAGLTVTRLANGSGLVSFACTDYQAGRRWARQSIDLSIMAGSVQLARDGKIIRMHPIRHDQARELGAFVNPKGRVLGPARAARPGRPAGPGTWLWP